MCFCHMLILFYIKTFLKNVFKNVIMISVSKSLNLNQARQNVLPDLGPKCLQKLSADDTSRQRASPN